MRARPKPYAAPITARPPTHMVRVSSPTVPGAVEFLQHTSTPIDLMWRRDQLSFEQYTAAERLYRAFETVRGAGIGSTMDFDRPRGGGTQSTTPPPATLQAAEYLRQARNVLYSGAHDVIRLVVYECRTVEQAADWLHGHAATREERREVGRRLRYGLSHMAEKWWGRADGPSGKMRAFRDAHFAMTAETPQTITPGKVAHAVAGKVTTS